MTTLFPHLHEKVSEECLIKLNNSTFTETGVNADKVGTLTMVAMLLVVVGGFFAFFAMCAVCLNKRCVPKIRQKNEKISKLLKKNPPTSKREKCALIVHCFVECICIYLNVFCKLKKKTINHMYIIYILLWTYSSNSFVRAGS